MCCVVMPQHLYPWEDDKHLAIKCGKCTWQLPSTLALSAFSYLAWIYFIRWTICLNAVYHAEIEIRLLHGEFSQELLTFLTEKTYWKFDLDRIDILTWKFCPENVFLSENQRPVMALDQFVNAVQTLSSQVAWLCYLSPDPPDSITTIWWSTDPPDNNSSRFTCF